MRRGIFFVAGLLAVALGLTPRLRGDDTKDVILEGSRIGQVRLGTSGEDLTKLLGKPTTDDAAMSLGVQAWTAKSPDGRTEQTEVTSRRDESGRRWNVIQVAVTSPFFRTHGGNSTRSDLDAIWREFPDLRYFAGNIGGHGSDLELYDSTTSGIAFLIERTNPVGKGEPWGKCRAIIVHPSGQEVKAMAVGAPLEGASGG